MCFGVGFLRSFGSSQKSREGIIRSECPVIVKRFPINTHYPLRIGVYVLLRNLGITAPARLQSGSTIYKQTTY